jgi:hypothetical protein
MQILNQIGFLPFVSVIQESLKSKPWFSMYYEAALCILCTKYILWHVHPLLGNYRETNNYATARKLQKGGGVFCVVRAEMLLAGQSVELSWLVSD